MKELGATIDVNGVRLSGKRGVQITIPRWYARKVGLIAGESGMEIREVDDCLILVPIVEKSDFEEAKKRFRDKITG